MSYNVYDHATTEIYGALKWSAVSAHPTPIRHHTGFVSQERLNLCGQAQFVRHNMCIESGVQSWLKKEGRLRHRNGCHSRSAGTLAVRARLHCVGHNGLSNACKSTETLRSACLQAERRHRNNENLSDCFTFISVALSNLCLISANPQQPGASLKPSKCNSSNAIAELGIDKQALIKDANACLMLMHNLNAEV
jgi:hypothetical protein